MKNKLNLILSYFIAVVWFINGFVCKVLNLVPRHEEIVSRILGEDYSVGLTKTIGFAEILMTIWILSGIFSRFNAVLQIILVILMNILEFFLVPDLLLFGRFNLVIACLFVSLIYINEFYLKENKIV